MEYKTKTLLEKLQEARDCVKSTTHKKDGRNEYSQYDYFTPETVDKIVTEACTKAKIIPLCNLVRDEFGLYQQMEIYDLESTETRPLKFKLATVQGQMKATNEAQQMGGTDTYSERYIKMKVFEIKDNNLDFDSKDNRPAKSVVNAIGNKAGDDLDL